MAYREHQTYDQFTAPGNGTAADVKWKRNHVMAFTVASIDTNVVVRMEGSIDGTSFFNLNSQDSDTTITSNGTTCLYVDNIPLKHIRPVFVSESGGTAATIDCKSTSEGDE